MKPLSSPQPLSSFSALILLPSCPLPSHHLLSLCFNPLTFFPFTFSWPFCPVLIFFLSFLPPFYLPFLRAAVPDSPVVDLFPAMQVFLVFAPFISAKPVPPPIPLQSTWWIDPVRVRMCIVLGPYMCQGVYICVLHWFMSVYIDYQELILMLYVYG